MSATSFVTGRLVGKNIAMEARSQGFTSRAGHIECSVTNGSPPLRRFFGAGLPRCSSRGDDPATRNTLRRNTANTTKIFSNFTNFVA